MRTDLPTRRAALLGAGIAALLVVATPWAASANAVAGPRIVANPNNVMVNSAVSLHGTGFGADTVVQLTECSRTSWIVPQQFCSKGNTRSVRTNRRGAFVTSFTMNLCPQSKPSTGPVTQRTCYVGEIKPSGVDTVQLVGAAKITVTYP